CAEPCEEKLAFMGASIDVLYGRHPVSKSEWRFWISGCSSISGLLMQVLCLLAPMESAGPLLIPAMGLMP
ncbi:MAG: hypothetical protein OXI66_15010, partial [Boseongicola sp.]|nr:hypothetical protein [Boseongicola sp.]